MLSSLNAVISTNERNWILISHVIFKLHYNQIYQLKTTNELHSTYLEQKKKLIFFDKNMEDADQSAPCIGM